MIELMYVSNNNAKHFVAVGIPEEDLPLEQELGAGSTCRMLDTGQFYIYHAGTGKWYRQPPALSEGSIPVRGIDYWTEEDIAVIKAYVDETILGGMW